MLGWVLNLGFAGGGGAVAAATDQYWHLTKCHGLRSWLGPWLSVPPIGWLLDRLGA